MNECKVIEYRGTQFELWIQDSGTSVWVNIAGTSRSGKAVVCHEPDRDKPYDHIVNGAPVMVGYPEIEKFHKRFFSLQEAIYSVCDDLLERPTEAEMVDKETRSKEMMREAWDSIDVEPEFRERKRHWR